MSKDDEEVYTLVDAGRQLGYPPKTLRAYVTRKLLKVFKRPGYGNVDFVNASEIERFQREHKRKPRKKQKDE